MLSKVEGEEKLWESECLHKSLESRQHVLKRLQQHGGESSMALLIVRDIAGHTFCRRAPYGERGRHLLLPHLPQQPCRQPHREELPTAHCEMTKGPQHTELLDCVHRALHGEQEKPTQNVITSTCCSVCVKFNLLPETLPLKSREQGIDLKAEKDI